MNYIINPSVFYWISVLHGLSFVCILFLVLGSVGTIIFSIIKMVDGCCMDEDEKKSIKTVFKICVPLLIIGLLGVVFVPDKQTMIEMLIAKTVTVDNAEWTVDAVKQAVDYIVTAIQSLK